MRSISPSDKTALLVTRTHVARDPRLRRQLDWLVSEGWSVDTVGTGEAGDMPVRQHFTMAAPLRVLEYRLGFLGFLHTLPFRVRFQLLSKRRIPLDVVARVRERAYQLVLFNDIHLLPWLTDTRTFDPVNPVAHVHLDIHEYFPTELPKNTRARFMLNGYYQWVRSFIAHPLIDSRSVVSAMAEEYATEFSIPLPSIVRNCPPYLAQSPSSVDPDRIKLIHHGVAAWRRGFREMVEAMRLVDDRFSLTFMLAGNQKTILELQEHCRDQSHRIFFEPAVPMESLSRVVNKYDAEVMFFPRPPGHGGFGLPNKFFEAIQGRLAMVIGPTPPMVEIVAASGNGVIARDWSPESLAEAINSLTPEMVVAMKQASDRIAPEHTAETEKSQFFASLGLREADSTGR